MTLNEIFSKSYLFDSNPPRESRLYLPLIILFSLLVIMSITVKLLPAKLKNVTNRYFTAFLASGILGFVYLFGRYEGLPWVGARITLVAIGLLVAIWVGIILAWTVRFVPKKIREEQVEERYQRYLPKSKTAK
ncbi:MAG: hypothetical protein AAB360_04200 [Patescibacteria group bacterium]